MEQTRQKLYIYIWEERPPSSVFFGFLGALQHFPIEFLCYAYTTKKSIARSTIRADRGASKSEKTQISYWTLESSLLL